jgi:hypothetical protein
LLPREGGSGCLACFRAEEKGKLWFFLLLRERRPGSKRMIWWKAAALADFKRRKREETPKIEGAVTVLMTRRGKSGEGTCSVLGETAVRFSRFGPPPPHPQREGRRLAKKSDFFGVLWVLGFFLFLFYQNFSPRE